MFKKSSELSIIHKTIVKEFSSLRENQTLIGITEYKGQNHYCFTAYETSSLILEFCVNDVLLVGLTTDPKTKYFVTKKNFYKFWSLIVQYGNLAIQKNNKSFMNSLMKVS